MKMAEQRKSQQGIQKLDYLYRAESGEGEDVIYSKYEQDYSKQWIPEERDGLWTYLSSKGKLLTPFQYESVEKVC